MAAFGEDYRGGRRRLFRAENPAGPWLAIGFAVGLVILNQLLQSVFGLASVHLLFGGMTEDAGNIIKGFLVGIFPASVLTVLAAWYLAKSRGGHPLRVLNLHPPRLGWLGWLAVVAGFLAAMYAMLTAVVLVFDIDLAQYEPIEGEDNADQIGKVKQAMFDIAHDPRLFMLVLPSVVIGAPLAEEFIFRGQLFVALSQTRLGVAGATLVTSALWSLMHATEPWFSVAIIFIMGLMFGYFMWRFGSLWVTVACHAAWNGVYSMIMFASVGQ